MSATTIVSTLLPIIGFINGVFMATSPAKAAKKIYKFDEKEIKPQVTNLVRANGASALRVAVLEIILSFTNTDYKGCMYCHGSASCLPSEPHGAKKRDWANASRVKKRYKNCGGN